MNPFINSVTQDFIMSEMTRKQTNQISTNCEFQNWMKSESVYNCERSTKRMEKDEYLQKVKAQLVEKSRPTRKNIANALIVLAKRIETA